MEKTPPKQFHLMGKMRDTLNEVHFILTPKEEITILYVNAGNGVLKQIEMTHKTDCAPIPTTTTSGWDIPAYGEFTNTFNRGLTYNLRLKSCLFYTGDGYPQSVAGIEEVEEEYFSVGTISDMLLAGIPTDLAKTAF